MTATRDLAYVRPQYVRYSNDSVDRRVVEKIKRDFDWDKYRYPVGWPSGDGVILTDGNHRVTALVENGERLIPFVPLTKKEFDHVAFSKRTVDLNVRVPEIVRIVK